MVNLIAHRDEWRSRLSNKKTGNHVYQEMMGHTKLIQTVYVAYLQFLAGNIGILPARNEFEPFK